MIFYLAHKNIWRKPLRSLAAIISVSLVLWIALFLIAFAKGLNRQRLDNQLNQTLGHLKITNPNFDQEKDIAAFIKNPQNVFLALSQIPEIQSFSLRFNTYGLIATSSKSVKVDIYGVIAEKEKTVLNLYTKIKHGVYLDKSSFKNPILIGYRLAQKLNISLNDTLGLSFQGLENQLIQTHFQVSGIYQIANANYEESHVFINYKAVQVLLNKPNKIAHQILCKLNDYQKTPKIIKDLQTKLKGYHINSWFEISPHLAYIDMLMDVFFAFFLLILLFLLSMLISNITLMSVLERIWELGMFHALGMSRQNIFKMILTENILLSLYGVPPGFLLAIFSIGLANFTGIDIYFLAQGFENLGYESLVYPQISIRDYLISVFVVFLTAFASGFYPAFQATKIKPAEAIR